MSWIKLKRVGDSDLNLQRTKARDHHKEPQEDKRTKNKGGSGYFRFGEAKASPSFTLFSDGHVPKQQVLKAFLNCLFI